MRAARWPLVSGIVLTMAMTMGLPAQASETTICTGYVSCVLDGKSDAGYGLVSSIAYWGMTPGHNCTNYVAYRLTHGRTTSRPLNTGMAGTWGGAAKAAGVPVDDVPTVGSVAWWASYAAPAGEKGHVAYVEAVLSDGSILVSEDNLTGDFKWERFGRDGIGWPSGFIHYPESDGTPVGTFKSVSSPSAGVLDFWGTGSDPDLYAAAMTYVVSLGGPRDDPAAEQFTFLTPYLTFHQIRYPKTRGTVPIYLYATNLLGTAGHDTLIGERTVTIRSTSTTGASFTDPTITRSTYPHVSIKVRSGTPVGTITVKAGTKVLRTYSMPASRIGCVTLSLPKMSRGTHYLKVYYGGSTHHYGSRSSTITLRVR